MSSVPSSYQIGTLATWSSGFVVLYDRLYIPYEYTLDSRGVHLSDKVSLSDSERLTSNAISFLPALLRFWNSSNIANDFVPRNYRKAIAEATLLDNSI
jgi:hypothetical protein